MKHANLYIDRGERGFATLFALIMVGMLTLIGLAAMQTSNDDVSIAGNSLHEMKSFYAAEAGLEAAAAQIQQEYEETGAPPVAMPSDSNTINGCAFAYETNDDGPAVQKQLTSGTLAGLNAMVKTFTISSTGSNDAERAKVTLTQNFEAANIPIFQFAIFYDDELWASPAEAMVVNGRVHSNSDICLQASKSISFNGKVSSAGDIYHGYKYGIQSGVSGDVFFKHPNGVMVNMKQSGSWVDAEDPDWYNKATSLWGGNVRDKSFGQQGLKLPLKDKDNPRSIIEPAAISDDSYETKATLKFIEGRAFQKIGGVWNNVTAAMTAAGVITQTDDKFYDPREKKNVDALDLNIEKLYSAGYAPSNGIIYYSDTSAGSGEYKGLRLQNATTLNAGLTIASNNAVYTQGDFNTTAKKPASIISDALVVLSKNWDDANSTKSLSSRVAATTTINASFITGDNSLGANNYNGGVSNLPRYLEDWGSSRTINILGSMINLWESKYATGKWSLDYYDPPARNYSYDTDLNDPSKMPPGTPQLLVFQRTGWQQQHLALAE